MLFHLDDSLAEDIVDGIDRAAVVLVCITQKYYESPYCKKGAFAVILLVCSFLVSIINRH